MPVLARGISSLCGSPAKWPGLRDFAACDRALATSLSILSHCFAFIFLSRILPRRPRIVRHRRHKCGELPVSRGARTSGTVQGIHHKAGYISSSWPGLSPQTHRDIENTSIAHCKQSSILAQRYDLKSPCEPRFFAKLSRKAAHFKRASNAGQSPCPKSVRAYSTFGGT